MDWLGVTHFTAALLSLISGLPVFFTRKGTRQHRRLGWVYVSAMATVNVTALAIYDLFGGFGPFHVAALLSGATVVLGMIPVRRKEPKRLWIAYHGYWMVWSYAGLAAAAASEVSTRYLGYPFGLTVGLATLAVILVGWLIIRWRMPLILLRFGIDVKAPKGSEAATS